MDQFQDAVHQRLDDLDDQLRQCNENERLIHEQSVQLLSNVERLTPFLLQCTEQIESYQKLFHETETMENVLQLRQHIKQLQTELSEIFSPKLDQLNEQIQQYTSVHLRQESTQLSTTLLSLNNRFRIVTQELTRFLERIDERVEIETNSSIETYRKFMENLRVKLTRVRDDYRLTIEGKQRLLHVSRRDNDRPP